MENKDTKASEDSRSAMDTLIEGQNGILSRSDVALKGADLDTIESIYEEINELKYHVYSHHLCDRAKDLAKRGYDIVAERKKAGKTVSSKQALFVVKKVLIHWAEERPRMLYHALKMARNSINADPLNLQEVKDLQKVHKGSKNYLHGQFKNGWKRIGRDLRDLSSKAKICQRAWR
jgi:hypothetical protein